MLSIALLFAGIVIMCIIYAICAIFECAELAIKAVRNRATDKDWIVKLVAGLYGFVGIIVVMIYIITG